MYKHVTMHSFFTLSCTDSASDKLSSVMQHRHRRHIYYYSNFLFTIPYTCSSLPLITFSSSITSSPDLLQRHLLRQPHRFKHIPRISLGEEEEAGEKISRCTCTKKNRTHTLILILSCLILHLFPHIFCLPTRLLLFPAHTCPPPSLSLSLLSCLRVKFSRCT